MSETDAWHRALAASAAAAGPDWSRPPAAQPQGSWRCETAHLMALAVGGDDARAFLDAQLTCRVPAPDADAAQPGAWCNPQGRVVSTLLVVPAGEAGYLLVVPAALADALADGLRRYVLRARVSIDPLPALAPRFGVCGVPAQAFTEATGITAPTASWGAAVAAEGGLVAVPGALARWLVLASARSAAHWWQALEPIATARDQAQWRHLDIRAGWPWLDAVTSERFVPQALALDQTGAVSFDKGCYPGQEIVARIRYRGRPSQRLAGIAGPAPAPPPGTRLLVPGDTQARGRMLDAVVLADGRYEGLAVVATECAPDAELHVEGDEQAAARLQPWPRHA